MWRTEPGPESIRWTLVVILALASASAAMARNGTRVEVNSDKVLVINGRKVFPIGFTMPPPPDAKTPDGKDALAELRDAGATFLRTGPMGSAWNDDVIEREHRWLDAAAGHGLYCWVNLRELSCLEPGQSKEEAKLRAVVDRFKHHPGLGLWKNYDEAAWNKKSVEDMVRGYRVIKEQDPDHPVVQTHAPRGTVESLRPYNACADMLNLDI